MDYKQSDGFKVGKPCFSFLSTIRKQVIIDILMARLKVIADEIGRTRLDPNMSLFLILEINSVAHATPLTRL